MCLYPVPRKLYWPEHGYRIFYKKFTTGTLYDSLYHGSIHTILLGVYQVDFVYNVGWNMPGQIIKYRLSPQLPYGDGVLHTKVFKTKDMPQYRVVICHKNDLVAFGNQNDACFKKIYLPRESYNDISYPGKGLIRKLLTQGQL